MIAIIQNDPEVPPGVLAHALEKSRCPYRVVKLFSHDSLPPLEGLSGAVVLGGIMSVCDTEAFPFLVGLKEWIRKILGSAMPLLGICLGGQLLAEVGGGTVHLRSNEEFGCKPVTLTERGLLDPLFRGVESPFLTLHWHNDCLIPPPGAAHLASTPQCTYQAFRWGPCAYGLQFHPEVDRETVTGWAALMEGHRKVVTDFIASEAVIQEASFCLFRNFIALVGRKSPH